MDSEDGRSVEYRVDGVVSAPAPPAERIPQLAPVNTSANAGTATARAARLISPIVAATSRSTT